ncbi:hypothetical protein NQ317_003767 [Molorchus minor]|uniref:Uncharacterized protein n=1 Tax=Molorchus minor TaxID=1323400 RepID=A0ABQ9IZY6_9CUCU|nr:hypothetical protein NQ317_003767 [Molorchus minor]
MFKEPLAGIMVCLHSFCGDGGCSDWTWSDVSISGGGKGKLLLSFCILFEKNVKNKFASIFCLPPNTKDHYTTNRQTEIWPNSVSAAVGCKMSPPVWGKFTFKF